MHDPTYLRRSSLLTRSGAKLGIAAVFAAGIVTAVALRPARAPVIEVKQPAAVNQTTVLPFAVPAVIVVPAPAPPPTAEPAIAVPPPPRALVPMIDSSCLLGGESSCDWDTGFPAISADGTLIAHQHSPDDGGRGYPGLSIQLIDAKTSRIVTEYTVLSPDEYLEPEDTGIAKLRAKIVKRTAIAQRALDARRFRSMTPFQEVQEPRPADEWVDPAPPVRAERVGDAVRMIDSAANTVIWQRRFPVEAEYPQADHDWEKEGCYPSNTGSVYVSWDEVTRTVLTSVSYVSGPCYCSDQTKTYVTRF
ncbi:MAG: hypothetical protein H0T42_07210 [Deltaproteobacteria bacterium]|nr:hypothetical protein [Deltaproteobacteria bacterium]